MALEDIPDIVSCPDNEIDFIFPDFLDVFECGIDERVGRIAWSVWNSKVASSAIVILVKVCAKGADLG
jgi:hypothetical protein